VHPATAIFLRAIAAAIAGGAIGLLAYRVRALTRSGAYAATACGIVLYGAGGWPWAALVGAFFASSSALTRIEAPVTPARVHRRSAGRDSGASQLHLGADAAAGECPRRAIRSPDYGGRHWHQVAANGGVAALTACVYAVTGSRLALAAGAGAVAAATADTWATEVGRLGAALPVLITTGARVPHGTSGGVTPQGTAGAAAGALLIGATGAAFWSGAAWPFAIAVTLSGLSGAVLDSLLGAAVETRWGWIGNGVVNFTATVWGALAAVALVNRWA